MLTNETAMQVAQMSDAPIIIVTVLLTLLAIVGPMLEDD